MASADGKDSPFNSDGKSGATGNGSGGKMAGINGHRGPNIPQKMGPPDFCPDSVPPGGRVLKVDPPSDRQGLVGQTADGMKHKPFKLGGSAGGGENTPPDEAAPVGDIDNGDHGY